MCGVAEVGDVTVAVQVGVIAAVGVVAVAGGHEGDDHKALAAEALRMAQTVTFQGKAFLNQVERACNLCEEGEDNIMALQVDARDKRHKRITAKSIDFMYGHRGTHVYGWRSRKCRDFFYVHHHNQPKVLSVRI